MSDNFEALLEQSFAQCEMRTGELIKATVLSIDPEVVTVNANLKSDVVIFLSYSCWYFFYVRIVNFSNRTIK